MLFDYRPKVHAQLMDNYYTPGAKLDGRCLYPFLHARVGFSGKVYFCPFIRVEVGDLATSSLEEIWNGPKYVEMRRRLLDHGIFPVCRRCCKVELSPEPGGATVSRRRCAAARDSVDGRSMTVSDMLGRQTLLINPPLINGVAFTRQGRCQEREDVLGTTKPPYTLALMGALLRDAGCRVRLIDATAERLSTSEVIARLEGEGFRPSLIVFPSTTPTLDADVAQIGEAEAAFRRADVLLRPARVDNAGRVDAAGAGRRRHVRWRAGGGARRARRASTRSNVCGEIPSLTFRTQRHASRRIARTASSRRFSRRPARRGICSRSSTTRCRWSTSRTCSSKRAAAARTRATSASRPFIRATSSASAAPKSSSTKSSGRTASSAWTSSISGATPSR